MSGDLLLVNLGIALVAAAVFALLGRIIRMPSIVAYLLAGVVLGPMTGLVEFSSADGLIPKLGIVLLLFLVGLELSFDKIRGVGSVALAAGLGQVVFTAAGGLALCTLLGFTFIESLFLATALTFSSTVVVVKLLQEKGELDTLYGRIAVGIFLVQDLVVVLMLTLLTGVGRHEEISWELMGRGVGAAFGGTLVLLALVLLASRHVLGRPLAWAARSSETLIILSLAWCFLVVLIAQWFQLSVEIGAFLAGLGLAQFPFNDDLRRRLHPLMNFCIAVFFVSLGLEMDFGGGAADWRSTLVLSLFVLIGNPFIFLLIIARMGYSRRTSFQAGVTVAQISEFSFILVAMGLQAGLLGANILSITALVGLVTITGSAYLILYSDPLYRLADRLGLLFWLPDHADESEAKAGTGRSDHVIVVGMNTLGRELVRRLHERGERVLAIDTDPAKLAGLPGETLVGNVEYLSVLEEAGFAKARLLVSALKIEEVNDLLAYRPYCSDVPCAINVMDLGAVDRLLEFNAGYLMVPKVDGVKAQHRVLEEKGFLPR